MPYNYQAALQSGQSEDDVINYLLYTRSRKFNLDGAIKAGNSKEDVIKYLSQDDKDEVPEAEAPKDSIASSIIKATPVLSVGADVAAGVAKGALSTVKGASGLGERAMNSFWKLVLPKSAEKKLGLENKPTLASGGETSAQQLQTQTEGALGMEKGQLTTGKNTAQKIGKGVEQVAEFFVPGGAATKVTKVVETAETLAKVPKLAKFLGLATRSAAEAGIVGGQTSVQQGDINDNAKLASIIGAMFPVAGAGIKATKNALAKGGEAVGEKISQTLIRPNASDLADGFKIENVRKYDLGGNLEETAVKVHTKLNEFSNLLKEKLQGATGNINLNTVYDDTVAALTANKRSNFGDVAATKRVLEGLKNEIVESGNPIVNAYDATLVKRGAGTKGSWAFGRTDPDAGAIEKVYNSFYSTLKTAIEKNSSPEVSQLNKQISELIPISNAVIRRLPVAQRNNVLSLTDSIGYFASLFDPKALALIGAKRLSQSGKFADFLIKASEKLNNPAISKIGKRILGE